MFIDNPKDSIFGKYYKWEVKDSYKSISTIEPEIGYRWTLGNRVGFHCLD